MKANHKSMIRGAKMISPVLLGVIPFAVITGITAVNTGISVGVALLMSVFIFAGSAQLAIFQLLHMSASAIVIIYTALVINLRYLIYSLSIAPHFKKESICWKAFLAYLMTDQGYALSMVRFINEPDEDPKWFYFGASFFLWIVWQAFTVAGLLVGSIIPAGIGLDFAIPLTFIAVLFGSVSDKAAMISVVTSAVVAVAAFNLPLNAGLIIAAMSGILAGSIAERVLSRREAGDMNG